MNEEEKAIKILQEFKKTGYHTLRYKYKTDRIHTNKLIERSIDTVLNLIDKQNKVIDEMAYCFDNYQICEYEIQDSRDRKCEYIADDEQPHCKDCIKQYFIRKVEEDDHRTS